MKLDGVATAWLLLHHLLGPNLDPHTMYEIPGVGGSSPAFSHLSFSFITWRYLRRQGV